MKTLQRGQLAVAAIGALIAASSAQAVELTNVDYHYAKRAWSAEVEPIPLLLNAIPGAGAVGVGGEAFVSEQVSVFATGTYLGADFSRDLLKNAKEKTKGVVPNDLTAWNAELGARYYTAFTGDSWYVGGQLGYASVAGTWEYKDATFDQDSTALQPGVNGGYRWVWDNGFMTRLGGTVAGNISQTSTITNRTVTAATPSGRDKLRDIERAPTVASVDFGLGWAF